jgi:hypothetical protein
MNTHSRKKVHAHLLGLFGRAPALAKNGSGSGSFGGATSLVELEPFCKTFGKTASHVD